MTLNALFKKYAKCSMGMRSVMIGMQNQHIKLALCKPNYSSSIHWSVFSAIKSKQSEEALIPEVIFGMPTKEY
jgi:hypothetical protein